MKISNIHIKNFRNFIDLKLDKISFKALIIGKNDIGKSNLFFAIRLLLNRDFSEKYNPVASDINMFSGADFFSIRIIVENKERALFGDISSQEIQLEYFYSRTDDGPEIYIS